MIPEHRWIGHLALSCLLLTIAPPHTAAGADPAKSASPRGEVRITGLRVAVASMRIMMPHPKDSGTEISQAKLGDLIHWTEKAVADVDFADRHFKIKVRSLVKESLDRTILIEEWSDMSLLELLVIVATQGNLSIELTEDEIIFREMRAKS